MLTQTKSYHTITQNKYELSNTHPKSPKKASPQAKKILQKAREMSQKKRVIIRGSCWDYINAIYNQAGFPQKKQKIIFKSKKRGPYAKSSMLKTGDWIYHVNHSFHNVGHSGIFIGWIDKTKKLGLTLSYAGLGRKTPARYKVYDLSSVYHIIRPSKQ